MVARAKKLLSLASHPSTPDSEALAAMRAFRSEAEKQGGLDALFGQGGHVPAYIPMSRKLARIAELEGQVAEFERQQLKILAENRNLGVELERVRLENGRLQLELDGIKAAARRSIRTDPDGRMTYEEFAKQATNRLNDYQSWQINFQRQTGISRSLMAKWRSRGWVDPEAVAWLPKLSPVKIQPRHLTGWTIAEVNRLRRLLAMGRTEREIAAKLTEEFGRLVTENNIKSLKTQSRTRTGVFKNPAYGPPIGSCRKK